MQKGDTALLCCLYKQKLPGIVMRWIVILMSTLAWTSWASAEAQTKRAFIVGVGDYADLSDLQKTIGDATGYAEVFSQDLDFEVTKLIDPDTDAFFEAFDTFVDSIQPKDQVAFIFSGHGWASGGENYLALSDAPREGTIRALERKTVSLPTDILEVLKAREPGLVFAIIDACRDNPFDTGTRGMQRGLVAVPREEGVAVLFAAGATQTALDRLPTDGANGSPYSVFTRTLLPKLKDPQTPLARIYEDARTETALLAGSIEHEQRPAMYHELSIDFCFAGGDQCRVGVTLDQEQSDWLYISSDGYGHVNKCTKYERHLEKYPDGRFAEIAQRNLAAPECAQRAPSLLERMTQGVSPERP